MLNKLTGMLERYDMVSPGDTVYCAVSGGADSVALLFAMYLLAPKLRLRLGAAHFNHRLRAEESDRDEAFVRQLCHRLDIPLEVGSEEVVPGKKGLEAAARDARYRFFETLPGKIATAHTADDNAETVLMRMVRGTGLKGLGGISPVRGKLIRPMLLVTRQQVLSFLEEYHLDFVHDSSNATDAFLRNRLRHHVMPLLTEENPRLAENMSAMALRLRQDEEALTVSVTGDSLDVEVVRQLPQAVRSRALAAFLESSGVKEPEAEHIALAQALVFSQKPSASARFPGGVTLCRDYGKLRRLTAAQEVTPRLLPCPGTVELHEVGLRVTCREAESIVNTGECFTVRPEGDILIRCRGAGDEMRLNGGTKSLKKLFIDRKIPAQRRGCVPVVADATGVLGVDDIGVNLDRAAQALPAVQICFESVTTSDSL